MQYCVPAIDGAKCALILYCFLFSLSIEEIDDSGGLDSGKINTDENLIIAMETSMDDDEEESESSSKKRKEYDADKQKEKKVHCVF